MPGQEARENSVDQKLPSDISNSVRSVPIITPHLACHSLEGRRSQFNLSAFRIKAGKGLSFAIETSYGSQTRTTAPHESNRIELLTDSIRFEFNIEHNC